jgi:hypothetical protein
MEVLGPRIENPGQNPFYDFWSQTISVNGILDVFHFVLSCRAWKVGRDLHFFLLSLEGLKCVSDADRFLQNDLQSLPLFKALTWNGKVLDSGPLVRGFLVLSIQTGRIQQGRR